MFPFIVYLAIWHTKWQCLCMSKSLICLGSRHKLWEHKSWLNQ